MKKVLHIFLVALSCGVFAESYSVPSKITGVTFGPDLVRVYVEDVSGEFESCTVSSKKVAYVLNPTDLGGEIMTSVILTAKVSGQKIKFQSIGCKNHTCLLL